MQVGPDDFPSADKKPDHETEPPMGSEVVVKTEPDVKEYAYYYIHFKMEEGFSKDYDKIVLPGWTYQNKKHLGKKMGEEFTPDLSISTTLKSDTIISRRQAEDAAEAIFNTENVRRVLLSEHVKDYVKKSLPQPKPQGELPELVEQFEKLSHA
eukprot:TRINITY_DN68_c0_g1_i1.p1 TRINITY_DN68_c0_g1~~TRINITY_DN68_c0_g1_i1.p1  ORF type:complete len:153 (-),score=27.31 TRINITY_DN68_c0_g1_i1:113-571(-)